MGLTRRQFLKITGLTGVGLFLVSKGLNLWAFEPISDVENPLEFYPNRDW